MSADQQTIDMAHVLLNDSVSNAGRELDTDLNSANTANPCGSRPTLRIITERDIAENTEKTTAPQLAAAVILGSPINEDQQALVVDKHGIQELLKPYLDNGKIVKMTIILELDGGKKVILSGTK